MFQGIFCSFQKEKKRKFKIIMIHLKNQSCAIAYGYLSYVCIVNGFKSITNLEQITHV
jgi:hypothetical protein